MCCYYVITTMSTVGYGDIHANTSSERMFAVFLMVAGVVNFQFITGCLSSILTTADSSKAVLQEKILFLNKLSC